MEKIRVLFLAASPAVLQLSLDREHREITEKIRAGEHRDSLEVISRWAVRPDDLRQALLELQPHVLHFSGHGNASEELVLLDSQGNPKPVSKAALVHLLGVLKDNLRLVVLNACFSRPQAEAITQVIDCAVGMNRAVGDEAAIKFAAAFYHAVGFGRSIQTAFDLGRSALMLDGIPEDSTPELVSRAGVDPASIVLVPSPRQRHEVEPPADSRGGAPRVATPPSAKIRDPRPERIPSPQQTQNTASGRVINDDRKKFFISYPQGERDEENLARYLHAQLTAAGHEAFIDIGMTAGTDWIAEIGSRIKWCDFLIVLLSARSMASEMVHTEVRLAHLRHGETGWPKIIPVRVRYFGPLEYELDLYLGGLQYVKWDGPGFSERVQQEVLRATDACVAENSADSIARLTAPREPQPLDASHRPFASQDTRTAAVPGGTIRSDDSCYITRPQDEAVRKHAVDVGQTLVIKGPRQIGKSSLLLHYLSQCQTAGKKVAFVDFQIFSSDDLERYTTFLSRFALILQHRVKIKGAAPSIDSQFAMVQFIEQVILPAADGPLVIALDEVDRLLGRPYQSDFFSMLRLWHNNRSPLTPEWEALDLALVISTEPYLLIAADNRSPFNVGLLVQPQPFSKANCRELDQRFPGVLTTVQVDELWNLLQGHPFLTRLSYYRLTAADRISFDELIDRADDERGPFGDHLRALLVKLAQTPELLDAMKQLIRDGTKPSRDLYYRLFGAGLVQRDGDRVNPANLLYARYFRRAL